MDKLKLNLDDLVVETFAPAVRSSQTGTVHAHGSGPFTDECDSCGVETGCGGGCGTGPSDCGSCGCPSNTCYGYWTCDGVDTCNRTCPNGMTCVGEVC